MMMMMRKMTLRFFFVVMFLILFLFSNGFFLHLMIRKNPVRNQNGVQSPFLRLNERRGFRVFFFIVPVRRFA